MGTRLGSFSVLWLNQNSESWWLEKEVQTHAYKLPNANQPKIYFSVKRCSWEPIGDDQDNLPHEHQAIPSYLLDSTRGEPDDQSATFPSNTFQGICVEFQPSFWQNMRGCWTIDQPHRIIYNVNSFSTSHRKNFFLPSRIWVVHAVVCTAVALCDLNFLSWACCCNDFGTKGCNKSWRWVTLTINNIAVINYLWQFGQLQCLRLRQQRSPKSIRLVW